MDKIKGYLVLRLQQRMEFSDSPFPASVDFTKDKDFLGVCLVFRRKKDAEKYAGKEAEVRKITGA